MLEIDAADDAADDASNNAEDSANNAENAAEDNAENVAEDAVVSLAELTPREIVALLDRHIVGQAEAKRSVAIAVRNRWRRQKLPLEMRHEVSPKNILMIGPTGVGKTEIARRLAKLTGAPFIKVEATKYTEVGYYGRDVESMVRELVENAIGLVRERELKAIQEKAASRVEKQLLDVLVPTPITLETGPDGTPSIEHYRRSRQRMRELLRSGALDRRNVELKVEQKSSPVMLGGIGMEHMDMDLQRLFDKMLPKSNVRRGYTVAEARKVLHEQTCEALLEQRKVNAKAIEMAQETGIIFIDELDKIVASESKNADVSRQGVQRDLLPIVEGTTVQTRYGYIDTSNILFVAAGAFHQTKPSDLMPELQGRFPIRVELNALTKQDFIRILTEPKNALTKQYAALLATEGVELTFTEDAIETLAAFCYRVNETTQNIGARRLYTIMEKLLEDLSYDAPGLPASSLEVNAAYVTDKLKSIAEDEDLSRFIL